MTARPSFRPSVVVTGSVLFFVVSALIMFAGTEIGYRLFLENQNPANFKQPPESSTFLFFGNSIWTFDREVGYVYKPKHTWLGGFVQDGRLVGCDAQNKTDALGNTGRSGVGYFQADLKVLVFGDSVTEQPVNNLTYPMLLERELSQRLGRRASVINLGRDGYGVLQMVDLAVREIPRWKPDLVLINFITDDLDRARVWRTEMTVDGRRRVFTTPLPNPEPPPSQRVDTMLLAPEATIEWCDRLRVQADQSADPILRQLIDAYAAQTRDMSVKPALWDIDYSVVAEALINGDPFAFVWRRIPPTFNPRVRRDRYDDARLVQGLKMLQDYGVPVHFIHIPIYPEVKAGAYQYNMHKAALLADLERLLGRPVLESLPYVRVAPQDLDRMRISPADGAHPSPFGMQLHATALTAVLNQGGRLGN